MQRNFTNEVKDLYNENHVTMKNELKTLEDRQSMFMEERNEDYEKYYIIESNLYVQCNHYQNSNGIIHRNRVIILESIWTHKRPPNSQSNPEKKKAMLELPEYLILIYNTDP